MSLPLEDSIMREIGFGNHYTWFNGSGSCRGIRQRAARRLPQVLREHGLRPNGALMNAVMAVARWGDDSECVLTKTWQACATAIRAQMEGNVTEATDYIRANFARQAGEAMWLDKNGRMMTISGHWEVS